VILAQVREVLPVRAVASAFLLTLESEAQDGLWNRWNDCFVSTQAIKAEKEHFMSKSDFSASNMRELGDEGYRRWMTPSATDEQVTTSQPIVFLQSFRDPRVSASRTPLGAGPLSIVELFGLHNELFSVFARLAVVRCTTCNEPMESPQDFKLARLPEAGYIALSVENPKESISLADHCELLGAIRGIVGQQLVRVLDDESQRGVPVIALGAVAELNRIREEAVNWWKHGGGVLTLWHFTERSAQGEILCTATNQWRCFTCDTTEAPLDRDIVDTEPDCPTCKGRGIVSSRGRDDGACADCCGVGRISRLGRYFIGDVSLQDVRACSFLECQEMIVGKESLSQKLMRIHQMGFGSYPLATPVSWLSPGERNLASMVCAHLSGMDAISFKLDGAETCIADKALRERFGSQATLIRTKAPAVKARKEGELTSKGKRPAVVLRGLMEFGIVGEELLIHKDSLTSLEGESGCGKSRVLRALQERFRRRNATGSQDDFNGIEKCHLIDTCDVTKHQTVLEALGLEDLLAFEIASKREAQKLGVVFSELILSQSRYKCVACMEKENVDASSKAMCSVCEGGRYDRIIADISCGGVLVRDIMTRPCSQLWDVAWRGEELAAVADMLKHNCFDGVALGDLLFDSSPLDRRFLALFGALVRLRTQGGGSLARGQKRSKPLLILVDGPYILYSGHVEVLKNAVKSLCDEGHTIVYAGMPKALEFPGTSVIRLRSQSRPRKERLRGVTLKERYGRYVMME
jgi:hypothetical protein